MQMATSWCIPFQGGTAIRILTFYPPLVVLLIFNMVVLYLAYGKLKSNFERTGSFTGPQFFFFFVVVVVLGRWSLSWGSFFFFFSVPRQPTRLIFAYVTYCNCLCSL